MIGVLFGTAAALSLGLADFIARSTSRALSPEVAVLYALATAAAGFTLYVFASRTPVWFGFDNLWLVLLCGATYCLALLFLYGALSHGPVSVAAPIAASHPAFVIALLMLLGVLPTAQQWIGLAVTFAGVLVISRGPALVEAPARRKTMLLAMVASLSFACHLVALQEAVTHFGLVPTLWMVRVVALAVAMLLVVPRAGLVAIPRRWVPVVILQGALDLAGSAAVLAGSVGTSRAVVVVVASAFGGVTVLLARLILKEPMSRWQWIAMGLILAGCVLLAHAEG